MPIDIASFAHVNLNCSSLERSKPFYEEALGLRALVHTDPAPQDCSAFGLTEPGQWDAWMLGHTEPGAGIALDLLEWIRPRPLERTDWSARGFWILHFEVPDPAAASERTAQLGGQVKGALAYDPDGQPLFLEPGERNRLAAVTIACTDFDRSLDFYQEVLGLEVETLDTTCTGCPRSASLGLPADPSGFRVRLRDVADRGPTAREPHRIGLFRMAFIVKDIQSEHAELRRLGVPELSAIADLDLGPACPAPRCKALFFRDPDGACLELIEVAAPAAPPPRARA